MVDGINKITNTVWGVFIVIIGAVMYWRKLDVGAVAVMSVGSTLLGTSKSDKRPDSTTLTLDPPSTNKVPASLELPK